MIGLLALCGDPDRRLRLRSSAGPATTRWSRREVMRNRELHRLLRRRSSSCRRPSSPRCSTCRSSWRSSSATRRSEAGRRACCRCSATFAARLLRRRAALRPVRSQAARWSSGRPASPWSGAHPLLAVDEGSGYDSLIAGMVDPRDRDRQLLPDGDDGRGDLGRRIADQPRRRRSSTCSRSPAARSASA